MATHYKILGQSSPNATTATTLYTVPGETESVVSTITIANRSSVAATYRIAIRSNGDTLSNQHYVAYEIAIAGNDTTALTLGITIDSGDIIEVYASTENISFNAFGSEIS